MHSVASGETRPARAARRQRQGLDALRSARCQNVGTRVLIVVLSFAIAASTGCVAKGKDRTTLRAPQIAGLAALEILAGGAFLALGIEAKRHPSTSTSTASDDPDDIVPKSGYDRSFGPVFMLTVGTTMAGGGLIDMGYALYRALARDDEY
jgi:hypothetical protein